MPVTTRVLLTFVLPALFLAHAGTARAQTLVESSLEARFQLDLHVPDEPLARLIPSRWSLNVSAQGPAKDANLRAIFIERLTINGPEGRPVGDGSDLLVYLTVPVRDPNGDAAQLVVGGITADPSNAPGPFEVYLPATTATLRRSTTTTAGPIIESQDWTFTAATGEHLEMHIAFERGVGNRGGVREVRFHSARDPEIYEISRQQQVLDILRNVTTTPLDRVREFSFRAGGGSYASLFDGSERLLSWDNIVWLDREVLKP